MKVIVKETAFYNKKLVEEGEIIEIKEKEVPSWAKKIKEEKAPTKPTEPTVEPTQPTVEPTQPTVEPTADEDTLKAELETLKDIAIDNDLMIEVQEDIPLKEAIAVFKSKLKENGIEV